MQSKKKQIRSRWLRKLMRVHIFVTAFSLSVYFLVAFLNPGFLSYDLRQKYHVLADDTITLTATVLGPPEQPIVSGVSQCNAGVLSVLLDWADDVNTYTYDVVRDTLPLVSGLSPSGYSDTNVSLGTTYEYAVTAIGPMGPGFATSDPLSVTTLSECETVVVPPTVNITSFDGRGIDSYGGMPRVFDRRPTFAGTTNMSNAIIQVVIGPPSSFMAELSANANGFYEWQPPVNLSFGTQTFTVTAVDPSDSSRQASASLQFEIKKKSDGTGASNKQSSPPTNGAIIPLVGGAPIDYSLSVENREKKIFQGEALNILLFIKNIAAQYQNINIPIRFSIVDSQRNIITSLTSEELLRKGMEIQKQLNTPAYIAAGKYFVQTEILLGTTNVSRSDGFTVVETPLLHIGGGLFITYAEIVHNLSWVVLALLSLLLLWLFMFLREYGMYLHALRHITEQHLKKAGLMTKRKEEIR